ncbi:hypothetical protein BT93_G0903 [Corymbia citriodora subsp. variegata]|nr:hypothetical protein BT93_G0903 [Corymbia citriodora subsp. variegata]
MKRPARHICSILLLALLAVALGFRAVLRRGFVGSFELELERYGLASRRPPAPVFNASLLRYAEIDGAEEKFRRETQQLLEGKFVGHPQFRRFATRRRFTNFEPNGKINMVVQVSLAPRYHRYVQDFRKNLQDWTRKKRFEPDVMNDLIRLVKHPLDRHGGLVVSDRRYASCAVVGNSGILLQSEHGELIDSHEAVIRLNNAKIKGFERNVGSKTTISFVNSNILHLCARRERCVCHPYGADVPIVMIVKYYSVRRFAEETGKPLEAWDAAHDRVYFHYSSGMQAIMLALGICDRVSVFGFGKSESAKHHYYTNQKGELTLHDYQAEYELYHDLVERPQSIPFISDKFKFPPVTIYQ